MTKKNKVTNPCAKKKKEKEKKIIEFVVIIQMRIHLDVTSLLNPISGIISKWNLFAQLFYRDDICMRYRGRFAKSQWNRAIRRERERDREHGKYTWVKSLFAPGPPSPQAFQLLLTINGERGEDALLKLWFTGAESSLETIPLFHQKEF